MRATVWMGVIGVLAWGASSGEPAFAQQSNSPLYQPSPAAASPGWPAWQGMQDGSAGLAPLYVPAPRYPADSRNPTLDNRAPTLWPAAPGLHDSAPRLGMQPENGSVNGSMNGSMGNGFRRPDGLRSPGSAEPGRPAWR